jgi:hypothetical protein
LFLLLYGDSDTWRLTTADRVRGAVPGSTHGDVGLRSVGRARGPILILIATWAALATTGATLAAIATTIRATAARGAGFLEGFHLLGRQDLFQLGLGLLFELGDLRFLFIRQAEFLLGKSGNQVKPAARPAAPFPTTRPTAVRTSASGTAAVLFCRRLIAWPVVCRSQRDAGKNSNCQ